jgi:hypothetical protein
MKFLSPPTPHNRRSWTFIAAIPAIYSKAATPASKIIPPKDTNHPTKTVNFPNLIAFIHLVVYFATGPKPLPNRALHIERSKASSIRCEYSLLSLRPYPVASYVFFLVFLSLLSPPFITPVIEGGLRAGFSSTATCT